MNTIDFLDKTLYTHDLFLAEKESAYFVRKILRGGCDKITPLTDGLLHKQPLAVQAACENPISIITGPPGTGKTTCLRQVINSFKKAGMRGIIMCPTGKAAKRADEVVNKDTSFIDSVKCSTIHSGLQFSPAEGGFVFNRLNRFSFDYIVFDEFSMEDIFIFRDSIEAIDPRKTRIVFSGDQYQLPSIGPGNVARDLISSGKIPTVELDVIMRTGKDSGIAYNASKILKGEELTKIDPHTGEEFKDFFFVPRKSEGDTCNSLVKYIAEDLPSKRKLNPMHDIQCICPGKMSFVGVKNMNNLLRDKLLQNKGEKLGGFYKGDKVINLTNDKARNIVNGDVGFVKEIVNGQSGRHITVDFGLKSGPNLDGMVDFKGEGLDKLTLAYALTAHRTQGSEYKACLMPIHSCHTILLTRNLIYTMFTRGKELSVMIGDSEVFRRGIQNNRAEKRMTRLAKYIAA